MASKRLAAGRRESEQEKEKYSNETPTTTQARSLKATPQKSNAGNGQPKKLLVDIISTSEFPPHPLTCRTMTLYREVVVVQVREIPDDVVNPTTF